MFRIRQLNKIVFPAAFFCSLTTGVSAQTSDIRRELGGLPSELSIIRTYNSQSRHNGLFGVGWSTGFEESLTVIDGTTISVSFDDGKAVYFGRIGNTSTYNAYLPPDDRSNVSVNSDNTYTLTLKTGERRIFGANGRVLFKTDRNNNTTSFGYNGSGYLTAITSPAGRTLKLTYNSQGKVVYVSDALGAVASYVYDDATGLLIRVTYADGSMYRYFYTNAGSIWRLYMVMDALDNILEYHEYDGQGRAVTSEISNGVEKYTISYTSATETQVVDALNRITKVTFKREGGESVVTS